MNSLGIPAIFCRREREFAALCAKALPFVSESFCEASTSARAHERVCTGLHGKWMQRCSPVAPRGGWRTVHHDHRHDHHHNHHQHDQHGHHAGSRRPITLEEMEKACWSCDKLVKRGGLVCHGCETIQPPDESLNYFELFSLPSNNFDVNPQLLERRYKQLQWNLHPDKMGHKPAEEQEFSAQQASIVNLAYSILKSPLSRANYLLALRGISAGDNFEGTIEDPELLMEVLEAREEVESTDDPGTLSKLLARNRQQQDGLVRALSAAFRADDMQAAVALTNQLQYVAKLEQEIVRKLPQL